MQHPFAGIIPKTDTPPEQPPLQARRSLLRAGLALFAGLFGLGAAPPFRPKPLPPQPTTLAVGEEGGRRPIISSAARNEEGGRAPIAPPRATTLAAGEEGGRPGISSAALNEEGGRPIRPLPPPPPPPQQRQQL